MGNETLQQFAALDLDYLIVGGGTAGLAVAARLTSDPEFCVGVIEAGPSVLNIDDNGAINVPGRYGETIGSKYDWKFKTTPQPGLGGKITTKATRSHIRWHKCAQSDGVKSGPSQRL